MKTKSQRLSKLPQDTLDQLSTLARTLKTCGRSVYETTKDSKWHNLFTITYNAIDGTCNIEMFDGSDKYTLEEFESLR